MAQFRGRLTSTATDSVDQTAREGYFTSGIPQSLDKGGDSASVVQIEIAFSVLNKQVVIGALYHILQLA